MVILNWADYNRELHWFSQRESGRLDVFLSRNIGVGSARL